MIKRFTAPVGIRATFWRALLNIPKQPMVIAHRGASAYLPENTLPAYALAVEQGSDMIEIDLHLTQDDRIVIAHDADLGHLGASGTIAQSTLAQMKALDAGHRRGQPGEVPTLEEVLDEFAQRIPFNLELKWSSEGDYLGLEGRSLEAIDSRGVLGQTLFSSFRESVLREIKRLAPEARIALLIDPREPGPQLHRMVERAHELEAEALNPHFLLVTEELVTRAHHLGLSVNTYTMDDEDGMKRLVDLGVDGIFTNCPDKMRALWPNG